MSNKPVRCNNCNAAAKVVVENDRPINVICSNCGESESYAQVTKALGSRVTAYAAERINRSLRDWAKRDKNVRYKPGMGRRSVSRFRVDL